MKESLDDSADPCNDFYTFACGGFNTKAVIPDDKSSYTTFDVVKDKMEEQVQFFWIKTVKVDLSSCPKPFLERVGNCWKKEFWRTILSLTR